MTRERCTNIVRTSYRTGCVRVRTSALLIQKYEKITAKITNYISEPPPMRHNFNLSTYLQAPPKTSKERSFYTDRFYTHHRAIELSDFYIQFEWQR